MSLVSRIALGLFLLAVGGAGCGPSPAAGGGGAPIEFDPCAPLALVADPGATAAQVQGILDGLALWNGTAGTRLSLAPAAGAADAGASPSPALPVHYQAAGAPFHGLYDAVDAAVFINDDLAGSALPIVMAHEIGHAFGLVHIPDGVRPSLMNPDNLTVTPTAADVATLATTWGRCGPIDAAGPQ